VGDVKPISNIQWQQQPNSHSSIPPGNKFTHNNCLHIHPTTTIAGFSSCPGRL